MPIGDRGFLYGDGAFDTIRFHRGAPFRIDVHLARLRNSLEILRIGTAWSDRDLRNGLHKLVEENRVADGLARITVTAGDGPNDVGVTAIASRLLPEVPPAPALHVAAAARRMSGPLSQAKSLSRAAESVAFREARAEGAFDAILMNEKGRVVETTARNLFIVTDGGLWTPPTTDGALAGVTRATVLEIASEEGLAVRERSLPLDRLRSAQELFLTGSGVGVLGIASVDGHRFPPGAPITARLRTAYGLVLDRDSRW